MKLKTIRAEPSHEPDPGAMGLVEFIPVLVMHTFNRMENYDFASGNPAACG